MKLTKWGPGVRLIAADLGTDLSRVTLAVEDMHCRRKLLLAFLQRTLETEEATLSYEPEGAPVAGGAAAGWFVSSASRDGVLVLVMARQPVGIDVEVEGEIIEPAWNVLHPAEIEQLKRCDPLGQYRRFLKIWTLKEAYVKALRTGLTREPSAINTLEAENHLRITDAGQTHLLHSAETQIDKHTDRVIVISTITLKSPALGTVSPAPAVPPPQHRAP